MLKGLKAMSKAGFDDIDRVSEIDRMQKTISRDRVKHISVELADMLIKEKYAHDKTMTKELIDEENGMSQYIPEVQEEFNSFFDTVENLIVENFKLTQYSNTEDYYINPFDDLCDDGCKDELAVRNCPDA